MRGQRMNEAQATTVARLLAKGWRGGSLFALAVPLYRDRPYRFGRWPNSPDPCVIHVRRDGRVYRGYPGHSSVSERNSKKYQYSKHRRRR
jgi:hypothetical protein